VFCRDFGFEESRAQLSDCEPNILAPSIESMPSKRPELMLKNQAVVKDTAGTIFILLI
jgi:hypothetical protein